MTINEIKTQLIELKDNLQSFKTSDAELVEIYKNDIEALKRAVRIINCHESLKKSFNNLCVQLASEQQATVTEYCPHCDTEVSVKWDIFKDGHSIYCPKCGTRIMLCSECPARDDEMTCDWVEDKVPCCSWDNIEGKENG
jgi:DNA-directed RNA polymerase subunit RPC12/RpoP